MAMAAGTFADEPIERRPGDFYRSKTGTPYVAHPDGVLIKPKRKADPPQIKRLAYGRPSGFGKLIEDTYNLSKWSERTVALGLGVDYQLACDMLAAPELVAMCAQLVGRDRDTTEWRSDADRIVAEAKRLAKGGLAAERGTHAHALTEEDDQERDWIVLAESGEILGLERGVQQALVQAWRDMLVRDGLEILATEMAVVRDEWRMAGTLDRIARLTKPLRFTLATGEIVELAADTVVVLDIKSGKRRTDTHGVVMYWQGYAIQIATYAGGCVYDTETDTRSPFPWPVHQQWALIAHLDVLSTIAGEPKCELVLVDIEAGREVGARLCIDAKAWGKRSNLFSVAQIEAEGAATREEPDPTEPPVATQAVGGTTPSASPISEACDASDEPQLAAAIPPVAAAAAPTNQELHARLRRHPDIDEGTVDQPDALDLAFKRMEKHFLALDEVTRHYAAELQRQAAHSACGFHAAHAHTLRRFELIRGLITLGAAGLLIDDELLPDEDLIRYLVHHVTGDDVALFPVIRPGHALGSLDATEAQAFAIACDQLAADQISLTFTASGEPQFVTRRAA